MEKNNKMVLVIAVLILGLVVGYMLGQKNEDSRYATGRHMMPNGEMMDNDVSVDMSHMMNDMMSGLYGKTGDDFDRAFLKEMIVHHEGAVLMAEETLKYAKHQELKDLARAIIMAQNKEIDQMKGWYKTWYSN